MCCGKGTVETLKVCCPGNGAVFEKKGVDWCIVLGVRAWSVEADDSEMLLL